MKLYFAPGACSLSDHIALHEAGLSFEHVAVDLKTKRTASGEDYAAINPKGYVPALVLDSGETLTENVAILDWIAHQAPQLRPEGPMGRTRLLETLAYISSELHKAFAPLIRKAPDDQQAKAAATIRKRLDYLADRMQGDHLFGSQVTVADFYLLVMLRWAQEFGVETSAKLDAYRDRLLQRPAVQTAMKHEGLT